MPPKNSSKNINSAKLKAEVSLIEVVNKNQFKPYTEVFSFLPANIVQQKLGNFFGFFKIRDLSDDSAYIVNFLTSVVKKEYYINPRRSVEDSFDSALHKANMALAELAKNGNINWIGNLDGAVCAIAENNLYFAVTGHASVLLLRNKMLSNISEGLTENNEDLHPAKTFIDVSSGALRLSDKIIVASEEIFHIFSFEEIKKNALRFPEDKFVQFIKTALTNRLETAETIIVDIKEQEQEEVSQKTKEEKIAKTFNAWGAQPYTKKTKQKNIEIKEQQLKTSEFTDKKTGHIYLQEQQEWISSKNKTALLIFAFKEKIADFWLWLSDISKKIIRFLWRKIRSAKTITFSKETSLSTPVKSSTKLIKEEGLLPFSKISTFFLKIISKCKNIQKIIVIFLPSLTRIKTIFVKMSHKQKFYGLLIVIFIIIAPLFYLNTKKQKEKELVMTPEIQAPKLIEILAADKNINLHTNVSLIYDQEKINKLEKTNNSLVFISDQAIIEKKGEEEIEKYNFPAETGNVIFTTFMKDLNLVFFFTNNKKLLSWSPVSHEFKENNINLQNDSAVKAIASYMTYLYIVTENNIWRYPRVEGGFGSGVSWLKENFDLSQAKAIAIDENIYLAAEDNSLNKLFKGKKQDFNLEPTTTSFKIDKIFTDNNTNNLYILDSNTGRIAKLSKDGIIISQYYNQQFEGARDLAIDEKNNKAYVVSADGKVLLLEL